ncbi:MAG: SprB repeat-containing protein, partial [Flavobacteriales bacterium]|nr:SprB repeat-containing protein [Flavobacteriales bacterium]
MSRPISLARAVLVVVAVLLSSSHLFSQAISVGVSLSDYNGFSVSCNGSEDGSINVTVSGGTAPYSFLWNTTNGSVAADGATVEDLTDLKAGTYTVIVNDSLGAADTVMVTLLSPSEMQMDGMMVELPSGQYYGCAACADGNGMMVVSGSVPPYSFTWPAAITHIDTDTSTSVSNFAPNTQYAFTVTDANGCSVEDDMQTPSYNAAAPLELFGTLSSFSGGHQVSIYGGSNGWIHLQVVGGTSPYTYGWSNGATTPDISNLSVGTYTVVVTDAAQQQAQKSFTLNGPANPLSATLGVSNPNCAGVSSGQLTTSVSGATPPYTYLWSTADGSPNVNGATSASINQLEPGIYSVSIKDANNDSLIVSDTIVAPIEIQTSIVPSVNEQGYHLLCAKGSSVVLDLSVLGGTAPYSYQWDNGKFTQDITVTQPGTYMVQVKDALNCLRYDSLLVVAPEDVEIDAQWHTYPNGKLFSCDTCNDAQLTVNFTGGVPPYIITLSSAWQTMMGPNFSGIYADTSYTLHFEDALGCVREMSGAEALVIPRDGFNSLGVSAQFSQYPGGYNISTSGGSDGWINLNIYGEMSQPTVIWNDGAVGKYRDGLSAGTYGATISDNAGQSITQSWTLTEPQSGISLMLQVSSANCTGNGNLMVMVNGGTPPYSFVWSNMYGQIAAAMWSNLSVQGDGQYDVMVVDANSDTAYSSIYYQSPHISMNATSPYVIGTYNTGCANGDGTIEMEVFGGTPPYVFTLDNYKGNRMMDTVMTTTHSIGGLNAGWYRATITGVNGCTVDADITLTAPPKPEFDAQWQTYPNGKLFSCDTCNDAQVTLNLTGGAQPYTVTLSSSMGSQTGSVFTGIYADTSYTLTMEDALGCVRTETLVIPREGFSSLGVSAQLSQYPGGYNVSTHGGNDGWINLNIYGEMSQPTVVWNDGMIGRNRNGLSAGTYEATISDNAGQSITRSYELIQPQSGPSVMLSGKYSNCQGGGNINAMVNGGTPPYSYRWYGPYGQLAEQWSNIWANQPGDYTLWVKDANNDSTEANIPMYPAPSLWVEVNSPMLHGTANAGCNI